MRFYPISHTVLIVTSCVLVALLPVFESRAGPTGISTTLRKQLEACAGLGGKLPGGMTALRLRSRQDVGAYLLTNGAKRRVALITGSACQLFAVGRATTRLWGRLVPGAGRVKAFVLSSSSKEQQALVLRDGKGKFLFATGLQCSQGVALSKIRLFADHETLRVDCRSGIGGADYEAYLSLWRVLEKRPRVLLVNLGVASVEQQGRKFCTTGPAGWMRVKQTGTRPTLEVAAGEPGSGTISTWSYNSARHTFIKSPRTRKVKLGKRTRCR